MKHTKGKWETKEWARSGTIEIVCNDISIADVWGLSVDAEEAHANAVLMAAAPELLELLECWVKFANKAIGESGYRSSMLTKSEEAIKKATKTNNNATKETI